MSRPLADALSKLLAAELPVSASQLTRAQRSALEEFARRTGAVQALTRGRGVVYEIRRPEGLKLELQRLRPGALEPADVQLPDRARNLAMHRDTKRGRHTHEHTYLLLKAVAPPCSWQSETKGILDVGGLSRIAGAAALEITPDDDWTSEGPIWLVENQALFHRTDWLPQHAHGTLLYYGGNLTQLQLAWLAARARASEIIYFPDYDGVGLLNYARLAAASAAPIHFWLIPGWQQLLRRYGSPTVWRNTLPQFNAACRSLMREGGDVDQRVRELVSELKMAGLALEHEAVWLSVAD
jgi:hypothetical protein